MKVSQLIKNSTWLPPRYEKDFRPVVSVLLPTYRRCKNGMLARCVESVLAQSYYEIELIIVDDASTDGSFELIEEYREMDARVGCIRHAQNIGLPAVSIYEAYMKSKGDFVSFAFDDNEFYPNAISDLLSECDKPGREIVYGHVDYFLPDPAGRGNHMIRSFGIATASSYALYSHNHIANNAVLARRTIFEKVGWYDPHIVIARLCDWDLWRRVSQVYEMVSVDVSVGKEFGPTLKDSLGSIYGMDFWAVEEFIRLPNRNDSLLPANYDSCDVCYVPKNASLRLTEVIEETKFLFSDKYWMNRQRSFSDGQILIVYPVMDESVSRYFDGLVKMGGRLRTIQYTGWNWTEIVGAQAVIFVRDPYGMSPWIQKCRKLSVPCYLFLDENYFHIPDAAYNMRRWADDKQTEAMLSEFNGILLGTMELYSFFSSRSLNANLKYYPMIMTKGDFFQSRQAGSLLSAVMTVVFMAEQCDHSLFASCVLPSIKRLSEMHAIRLVVIGAGKSDLEHFKTDKLDIIAFSLSPNRRVLISQLRRFNVSALVCPGIDPHNERKRTSALIDGAALRAVVILSSGDSRSSDQDSVYLVADSDISAWESCLKMVFDDNAARSELLSHNENYCMKHFDGTANDDVLEGILRSHKYAGALLREERFLKIINDMNSSQAGFISSLLSVCRRHMKVQLYSVVSASRRFSVVSRLYARMRNVPGVWNLIVWLRSRR